MEQRTFDRPQQLLLNSFKIIHIIGIFNTINS